MTNILFICSANIDRSPTAERLFSDVPGWEVKSAGTLSYAKQPIKSELLNWADEIYVMETHHLGTIRKIDPTSISKTTVLGIEDVYEGMNPKLVGILIREMAKYKNLYEWIQNKFIRKSK